MTLGRRKFARGNSYNIKWQLGVAGYGYIAMIIPVFMVGFLLIELG
jgi:hypothetical protein